VYLSIMRAPGQTGEAQGWVTGRKGPVVLAARWPQGQRWQRRFLRVTRIIQHCCTGRLGWSDGGTLALFCAAALRHSLAACAAGPKQAQRPTPHQVCALEAPGSCNPIRHAAQLMHAGERPQPKVICSACCCEPVCFTACARAARTAPRWLPLTGPTLAP
jgi:hypothetical protein